MALGINALIMNLADGVDHFARPVHRQRLEDKGYSIDNDIIAMSPKNCMYELKDVIEPDISVIVGAKSFNCSLLMLSAYSIYFEKISNVSAVTLPSDEVPTEAFDFISRWVVSDNPKIELRIMLKVYKAAQYLGIKALLDQLDYHFDNVELFTEQLAFKFYLSSAAKKMSPLDNIMLSRISKFFLMAVSSPQYLKMPIEDICQLLKFDHIGVCNELEVFYAAIRWLNFDWNARKNDALKIMNCVRFGLMSGIMLMELQVSSEEIVRKIIKREEVNQLITNARNIHCITLDILDQVNMNQIMEELNAKKPVPRKWVFDKFTKHHHRQGCKQWRNVQYSDFVQYLKRIKEEPTSWHELIFVDDVEKIPCCGNTN